MARAQVRDFLADRREIVIGEEDPITVVYRPGKNNAEFGRRIQEMVAAKDSNHKVTVFTVCTLISDWDITGPLVYDKPVLDRKGKPIQDAFGVDLTEEVTLVKEGDKIPVKSEFVQYLSTQLLSQIMEEVFKDLRPDPKAETT